MEKQTFHFDDEEKQKQFLKDLARLKKIREESAAKENRPRKDSVSWNVFEDEEINWDDDSAPEKEEELSFDEDLFDDVPMGEEELQTEEFFEDDLPEEEVRPPKRPVRQNRQKEQPPRKPKKKKKPFRITVRGIFTAVIAFLLLYGLQSLYFGAGGKQSGYYTVAVFGVDSRDGNLGKDALADVNMLVSLDRSTGDIRLCSLYRDTIIQINEDGKHHKLNEAYFKGGPDQALWAYKFNFDIEPDDYVTFNWKAVIDAINIMGGVDIDITEPEFAYINSFITETVNATGIGSVQLEHAGMNHLDGVQAVAYARLRLMDTDYNRTERQRRVVGLLVDKIKAADTKKRLEVVTSVLPETKTSMTPDDLIPFAKNARNFRIVETRGFPFDKKATYVGKMDVVAPVTMESNVTELHRFLFNDESYHPSATVKKISNYIIDQTGLQ